MIQRSVVIVGAGPAGMSAAITAVECGLQPTIIDENIDSGGQIYRQPPSTFRFEPSARGSLQSERGTELRKRFHAFSDRMELYQNTKVWGVFDSRRLAVTTTGGWQMIEAEQLVLAPGAYEYVPPFPGWTLPGVLTPGGAQLMTKSMHILPGRRALVVGTGPFLLVVANCLLDAGMEVVGVVECITRAETIKSLPGLLGNPGLLRQGWQYLRRLRQAGIPIHTGHVIVEAQGEGRVEQVRFAPCDQDWRPDVSRARTVSVDTLCVGYGFIPRTELAQLAGCRMRWVDELGGWIPNVDENLETSVSEVWTAGDGAGVAGAIVAEHAGTLAGLAVARRTGRLDVDTFQKLRRPVVARLRKLRRFRRTLDKLSRIRPQLSELASEDTLVCRCEELTRGEVEAGIAAGCTTIRTLKVATRLGMGLCQGRMCWPAMARLIALKTGKPIDQIGPLSIRPPIIPVTLGDLAETPSESSPISGGDREGGAITTGGSSL
jgi:NADPH-dependent 2,4-dienoyl-CoA reductase/sulfur reductase-like enzyme